MTRLARVVAVGVPHVRGLQIPVHDAPRVSHGQSFGNLGSESKGLCEGQFAALEASGHGFAFDQLHHEVVGADVMQGADVGMADGCNRTRLLPEAVEEGTLADLDSDGTLQAGIGRAVNLAHGSLPEQGFDFVGPQLGTGSELCIDGIGNQVRGMLIELEGVWNVSVNVTDCQTGAPIRTVVSLQQFLPDGSEIETANTASRGISEGVWGSAGGNDVAALYWFYRFNPDGTFASRATVTDKIVLGSNGQFTSSGTVLDYDANGKLLTTGCFTHTATRLAGFEPHGNDWKH